MSPVSGPPGFAAGYRVALPGDQGSSIVVFDPEEAARAFATNVRSTSASAVTLESVEVGEGMAHRVRPG